MTWFYPGANEYFAFRLSTHLDYHRTKLDPRVHDMLADYGVRFVLNHPTSRLSANDHGEALLELGIRQWTGFGAPRDKPAALAKWATIVSSQRDISRSLRARAYSSLAKGWLDRAEKGLPTATHHFIRRLYHAGENANQAIALGLTSSATLKVAKTIRSKGFGRLQDDKFPKYCMEKFERLTKIWEALDKHDAEAAAERLKREAKLSRDPLGYFCAAEDCGITVKKRSTLWECSGNCPRGLKPRYCSRECQRTDRKHHRPFCTPDATVSSVAPVNSTDASAIRRRKSRPNSPHNAISERFKLRAGSGASG